MPSQVTSGSCVERRKRKQATFFVGNCSIGKKEFGMSGRFPSLS